MRYDDIIDIKNPPMNHKRMSRYKRAAQFSPFSALTGYEDSIELENLVTYERPELSDDEKNNISDKIIYLTNNPQKIKILYFDASKIKEGGMYLVYDGIFKRIEEGNVLFSDGKKIPLEDLIEIILEE